jgi:hypothetical protein
MRAPQTFAERRVVKLIAGSRRVDPPSMDISALSGLAAAQGLFSGTAQAAAGVSAPAPGPGDGGAEEAVQVAVLQRALDMERGLVNILA